MVSFSFLAFFDRQTRCVVEWESGRALSFVLTLVQHGHIRLHTALNAKSVLDRRTLARHCVAIVVNDLESNIRLVGASGI